MITVIRLPTGYWSVLLDGAEIRNGFSTQAAAWEWVDRNEVHPLHERTSTASKWTLRRNAH
jgi:hypothetical protein